MSGQASTPSWASLEGPPNPLGATWIAGDDAWNFAVFSEPLLTRSTVARTAHWPRHPFHIRLLPVLYT